MLKTIVKRTLSVASLCVATYPLSGGDPAFAADGKLVCDEYGVTCEVVSESDGVANSGGGGEQSPAAPSGQGSTDLPSCIGTTEYGREFEGYFAGRAPSQPRADDPVWGSHEPGDGAIYVCESRRYNNSALETLTGLYWAPDAPDAEPPDPEVLAQRAVDNLEFEPAQLTTTLDDPGDIGYVGIPVWLWLENPGPSTIGPLTASAAAGENDQWRVTAEARLDRFEWDMGDGTVVTCTGPGEPYRDGSGMNDSDCSHRYEEQGNPHTITLRSFYRIEWSGIGEQGVIQHEVPPQTTEITVGELQVLRQ